MANLFMRYQYILYNPPGHEFHLLRRRLRNSLTHSSRGLQCRCHFESNAILSLGLLDSHTILSLVLYIMEHVPMGPLITVTLVKVSFGLAAYGGEGG